MDGGGLDMEGSGFGDRESEVWGDKIGIGFMHGCMLKLSRLLTSFSVSGLLPEVGFVPK